MRQGKPTRMKVKAATVRVRANRLHESPTTGGVITKHTGRTRERGILTPANQNVDVKAVLRVNQSETDREVHQHLEYPSLLFIITVTNFQIWTLLGQSHSEPYFTEQM